MTTTGPQKNAALRVWLAKWYPSKGSKSVPVARGFINFPTFLFVQLAERPLAHRCLLVITVTP